MVPPRKCTPSDDNLIVIQILHVRQRIDARAENVLRTLRRAGLGLGSPVLVITGYKENVLRLARQEFEDAANPLRSLALDRHDVTAEREHVPTRKLQLSTGKEIHWTFVIFGVQVRQDLNAHTSSYRRTRQCDRRAITED